MRLKQNPNAHSYTDNQRLGLYPQTRSILDSPTSDELDLESDFSKAIEPKLKAVYEAPLGYGIENQPSDEQSLFLWLTFFYHRHPESALALMTAILPFLQRGVNLGGQEALNLLELESEFNLTDERLLSILQLHADELTSLNGQLSLIRTTMKEVSGMVASLRVEGATDAELLDALEIYSVSRAAYRSTSIAITEGNRTLNAGLIWAYQRNGIEQVEFMPRADACRNICEPHRGERFPVDAIPADMEIPLHVLCRCLFAPVTSDWVASEQVWVGN